MRYRFYREHKYVSYQFSALEQLIAKTDFNERQQLQQVKTHLGELEMLMKGHAFWEDNTIHALLRKKKSTVHETIESDHLMHEKIFKALACLLDEIAESKNENEQLSMGHSFYLQYRLFVSDNLRHLHEEETIIMSELQKLYTDDELRAVDFNTYHQMTPEDMAHMIKILFPHMNSNDREAFLADIKDSEPEKYLNLMEEIR